MFLFKKPPSPALYDERSDQLTYLYVSAAQLSIPFNYLWFNEFYEILFYIHWLFSSNYYV